MVFSVTTYLALSHKSVSGLDSVVFLCKLSVKMAAPLSNCTTVEKQTVIGVVRLKCLKFIRECYHNMANAAWHRKMYMNGWTD
jgi:hypothetical protein